MTPTQQARQSLEAVKDILLRCEEAHIGAGDVLKHFKVFEALEMGHTISREKTELLREVNNLCYQYLQGKNYFSCGGCINRFIGPSYYKQLEKKVRQELDEYAMAQTREATMGLFLGLWELNVFSQIQMDEQNAGNEGKR